MFDIFRKSEYSKNIATLMTGTTLAQAISLFSAPILYRIYDKEDYGTLGVYMAVSGLIGVFSTMQYLQPILLEKEDIDAKKLMWLNRLINICITIFVFFVIFFIRAPLANWLNNPNLTNWLLLTPLSIFFLGQNQIFRVWANRKKEYKIMSFNSILTALLVPLVSISFGIYYKGPLGLFLGLMVSQVVPAIYLAIMLTKKENLGIRFFDYNFMKLKAIEYKSYPLYSLPSEFINRYTNQLPVFFLSTYMNPGIVGVYNLCVRMLGLPIQLLGRAIGEVFKQKATENFNSSGEFQMIFIKTFKNLAKISFIPFLILIFIAPDLFSFVFGEGWRASGEMAKILSGVYVVKLIVSPLSYAIFIKKKLKVGLLKEVITLFVTFSTFYICLSIFEYSHLTALYYFSISLIVLDSFYMTYLYKLSK